jgi:hypothetical protein
MMTREEVTAYPLPVRSIADRVADDVAPSTVAADSVAAAALALRATCRDAALDAWCLVGHLDTAGVRVPGVTLRQVAGCLDTAAALAGCGAPTWWGVDHVDGARDGARGVCECAGHSGIVGTIPGPDTSDAARALADRLAAMSREVCRDAAGIVDRATTSGAAWSGVELGRRGDALQRAAEAAAALARHVGTLRGIAARCDAFGTPVAGHVGDAVGVAVGGIRHAVTTYATSVR